MNLMLAEYQVSYHGDGEFDTHITYHGDGEFDTFSEREGYHGDGEFDTFLSLLMMLKPTAESLDSCLIPAPFCKTEMRILSLSFFGRDEILTIGIPWHSSNNISFTSKSDREGSLSKEEQSSSTDSWTSLHKSSIPI